MQGKGLVIIYVKVGGGGGLGGGGGGKICWKDSLLCLWGGALCDDTTKNGCGGDCVVY